MLGNFSLSEVRDMVRQCIDDGYLDQSDGKYPVVSLTADGRQALSGHQRIVQQKVVSAEPVPELPKRQQKRRAGAIDEDALRPCSIPCGQSAWNWPRTSIFRRSFIFPMHVVDMAALKPDSLEAMSDIKGVAASSSINMAASSSAPSSLILITIDFEVTYMSIADTQYLNIVENILDHGYFDNNRTGVRTYKLPHQIMQFD